MLVGDVTLSAAAAGERGPLNGGLSEPATGESAELSTGSKRDEADMLEPRPEIVFLLASELCST